jgi:hypothetical protein
MSVKFNKNAVGRLIPAEINGKSVIPFKELENTNLQEENMHLKLSLVQITLQMEIN